MHKWNKIVGSTYMAKLYSYSTTAIALVYSNNATSTPSSTEYLTTSTTTGVSDNVSQIK